jgi:hypothetical protein
MLAGVLGRQGMLTSLKHLIPSLIYPDVHGCPILKFVFPTRLVRLMTAPYIYVILLDTSVHAFRGAENSFVKLLKRDETN